MISAFAKNHETVLPTGLGGGKAMTREEIDRFEKSGGAKKFNIKSDSWKEPFERRVIVRDGQWRVVKPERYPNLPMVP